MKSFHLTNNNYLISNRINLLLIRKIAAAAAAVMSKRNKNACIHTIMTIYLTNHITPMNLRIIKFNNKMIDMKIKNKLNTL